MPSCCLYIFPVVEHCHALLPIGGVSRTRRLNVCGGGLTSSTITMVNTCAPKAASTIVPKLSRKLISSTSTEKNV